MKLNSILILAALTLTLSGSNAADPSPNTPAAAPRSGAVDFTKSTGWLETAVAEWSGVADATGYVVYCKLATAADSDYVKVDAELVRGTRVDIPGLPGNLAYDIKVVPLVAGNEAPDKAGVTRITTLAHDRSGFAFDKRSPPGVQGTTGGYNPDGSVNPESKILYISEATKDSVQMEVTKGRKTAMYTGLVAIQIARASAKSSVPLIVRFIGTIKPPADLGSDKFKMMQLKNSGNVTYEGIGTGAGFDGWGMDFQRCSNVEVRNLSFREQPEDQLSFQSNCLNLWLHNNDHFPGKGLPGGEKDKVLGDGSLDVKSGSSWVTTSYNTFHGTGKSNGVGFRKDTDALVMTYHHNFYDACGSRMPRISYVSMHVYNSYFEDAGIYCLGAANKSSVFVENNYFEHCNRPMIIASQGHDLSQSGSTLSHNDGGAIMTQGNFMNDYSSDPVRFDPAVDASPGPAVKGGAVYNNFHLKFGTDYPQVLDSPEEAKARVIRFAGQIK